MSNESPTILINKTDTNMVCYTPDLIVLDGNIWTGQNPLDYAIPLFILQLVLVLGTTRLVSFVLKPFHQPRVISEIIGGWILGPSILGQSNKFARVVFPMRSFMLFETMANIGVVYYLFLVGVKMDLSAIKQNGKKALSISIAGMLLPFLVGCSFSLLLFKKTPFMDNGTSIIFLAAALSVTAFPVVARILSELNIQNGEIRDIAMSCALINDIFAWVLLALAIDLAERNAPTFTFLWVIFANVGFVAFYVFVVRPALSWFIRQTPEGEPFTEFSKSVVLAGVMISGFITDAIGTYSAFGAFVFGLIIPNGALGITLVEKLEDIVSGLLLPLFFAHSGFKMDIRKIGGPFDWVMLIVILFIACAGKVLGTLLVALYYKMPFLEALTLGFLMNAKGLVEIVALAVGKEQRIIKGSTYAIVIMSSVIMTGIITPLVSRIYRPPKKFVASYKWRTIQTTRTDAELRIIACIHSPRNVPTIINLLQASHPNKNSPLCIFVLHLVELTVHSSASNILLHTHKRPSQPVANRTQAHTDHIISAFETFEQNAVYVTSECLTAISPYSTAHEHISNLAEDRRSAFIIIPFHKQQTVGGDMEVINPAFQILNQNMLANAPCSVGILVDRGLSASANLATNQEYSHHIAMLFFGGPDDREALSYTLRMSKNPRNSVSIIRFLPGESVVVEPSCCNTNDPQIDPTLGTKSKRAEKRLDDAHINEFRMTMAKDDESFEYTERVLNSADETIQEIRSLDKISDLFIVGRGQGVISPLTEGILEWSECPELGPIGDFLSSTDAPFEASVLVVQQYVGVRPQEEEEVGTPNSQDHQLEEPNLENQMNRWTMR
ncbi:cation/H(+) antiporter 15-like [Cornus florida]|uniref:cation/H(+) antiporter 15-like n=1 Tax=Cornus florida TaxID=4283 RepID=UPI00289E1F62|nr:cation/H(+) antiporter 15-like [Cornus florida]